MEKKFKIYDLTTEYEVNPIDVFTDRPRFSWKIDGYNGYVQKSYRIVVSSTLKNLENGKYDLWDSKVVESCNQVAIEYDGKKLDSNSQGYLKVFVTDSFGNENESEVGFFEIALLHDYDFKGCYQTVTAEFVEGAQYWRRPLMIQNRKITRARIYVSGLGYHEFLVNGKKVTDWKLSSGVTDYSKQKLYSTYDLTNILVPGGNCLGFILAGGWMGNKMINFQGFIDYEDGGRDEFCSSHNANIIRVTYGPIVRTTIYGGETYDAREEERLKDWCTYDYHADYDNDWVFSMNASPPSGQLVSQSFEPIREIERFSPKIVYSEGNRTIYDFNINMAGYLHIKVKGSKGSKVIINHSELLNSERTKLDTLNLRTAKQVDEYICKGEGIEEFSPTFTYHGFRYAEIILEGDVTLDFVEGVLIRTDVELVSSFECSNEVINRLHKNAVVTEGDNIHSVMTDCPQRDERFGWLNDWNSRLFELRYNYDTARLFQKVVRDINETQDEVGTIADTAPFHIGARPADPVCSSFELMPLENYMLRGDKRTIVKYYDNIKKWIDYLTSRTQDYLLSYSYYGDWVTPYPLYDENTKENEKTYPEFTSSIFYYWQVMLFTKLATIVKREDDVKKYTTLKNKIKSAINQKYYDKKTKSYHTGSQAANSLAVSMGLCRDEDRKEIVTNIVKDIVAHDYHNTTGNQAYRHMFYILTEEGFVDDLIKMFINPTYPSWGYQIANDAVSIWERWEAEGKIEMNSFNHPMFGGFDGWLFSRLGGLDFDNNCVASNRLLIKPYIPSTIDFVKASTKTVLGTYSVEWKKENNKIIYDIIVPYNSTALVSLYGKCVDCDVEYSYIEDRSQFTISGGKYHYECEVKNV